MWTGNTQKQPLQASLGWFDQSTSVIVVNMKHSE